MKDSRRFRFSIWVLALLLLMCNSHQPTNNTPPANVDCDTPIPYSCDNKPCVQSEIYDSNGVLIRENAALLPDSFSGPIGVYWDGRNMQGDTATCGLYTVKITGYYPESTVTSCLTILNSGPGIKGAAKGRIACDSLKVVCGGNYAEGTVSELVSPDSFNSDIGCICCE